MRINLKSQIPNNKEISNHKFQTKSGIAGLLKIGI